MSANPEVLLVEDMADTRLVLATELTENGFRIKDANSVEQAISILKTPPPPDIIVADIILPNRRLGFDIALATRELGLQVPFIFLTALSNENLSTLLEREEYQGLIFRSSILKKPFDLNSFTQRVRDASLRR